MDFNCGYVYNSIECCATKIFRIYMRVSRYKGVRSHPTLYCIHLFPGAY